MTGVMLQVGKPMRASGANGLETAVGATDLQVEKSLEVELVVNQ